MRLVQYSYPIYQRPAALSRYAGSPWSGLESEIDRLFAATIAPQIPVQLHADKTNLVVRAELPGVNRADIQVELAEGVLSIQAVRKTPVIEGQTAEDVTLSRAVQLPDEVQADKITAAYENGVLTITLPKREAAQPQKITIA